MATRLLPRVSWTGEWIVGTITSQASHGEIQVLKNQALLTLIFAIVIQYRMIWDGEIQDCHAPEALYELVSIMSWHLLRPLGRWSAIGHANGPPTAGMDQQRSWRCESAQAAQAVCI